MTSEQRERCVLMASLLERAADYWENGRTVPHDPVNDDYYYYIEIVSTGKDQVGVGPVYFALPRSFTNGSTMLGIDL